MRAARGYLHKATICSVVQHTKTVPETNARTAVDPKLEFSNANQDIRSLVLQLQGTPVLPSF